MDAMPLAGMDALPGSCVLFAGKETLVTGGAKVFSWTRRRQQTWTLLYLPAWTLCLDCVNLVGKETLVTCGAQTFSVEVRAEQAKLHGSCSSQHSRRRFPFALATAEGQGHGPLMAAGRLASLKGGMVSGSCHICERGQKAFNMSGPISYFDPPGSSGPWQPARADTAGSCRPQLS